MWMRAYGCMSLYLSLVFLFSCLIFSSLSLFPSISFHIFPSAFFAHQRDSPEVKDNPSLEQQVFHVLGRRSGESVASSLSSLQIPALVSQPCFLSFSICLPSLFLTPLMFSSMFMFSFIMEPTGSARDMTTTTNLCLKHTHPGSRSIFRCWSSTTALSAASLFCVLWILLKSPRRKVTSEECTAEPQSKIVTLWLRSFESRACKRHFYFLKQVNMMKP